jgi:hypothetical protein
MPYGVVQKEVLMQREAGETGGSAS